MKISRRIVPKGCQVDIVERGQPTFVVPTGKTSWSLAVSAAALPAGGRHRVRSRATDTAGNSADSPEVAFDLDYVPERTVFVDVSTGNDADDGLTPATAKASVPAAVAIASAAVAQVPSTVRIIIPNPPGGTMDALFRILADRIGRTHNITMIIEYKAGASTIIGTEHVARAAPDGATLLVAANSFVINPHVRKLNFDPLTSFEPICHIAEVPQAIAVHGKSPWKTLGDLVGAAKARPGEISIGSNGPTTSRANRAASSCERVHHGRSSRRADRGRRRATRAAGRQDRSTDRDTPGRRASGRSPSTSC